MKINFKTKIVDLKGNVIKEGLEELTVGNICANALVAYTEDKMEAKSKIENWELAQKIIKEKEVELTPEEIVLIKKVVNRHYGTLVVAQVFRALK